MSDEPWDAIRYLALAVSIVLVSPFALVCIILFGPPAIAWFAMDRLGVYELVCNFSHLESDLVSLLAGAGFLFSYIIFISWLST